MNYCCEQFAIETGQLQAPIGGGMLYPPSMRPNAQFERDEDGTWNINGCCGGGCFVVTKMKFCPFWEADSQIRQERRMQIEFTEREIDWLNNYAGNAGLSIPAAVRQAVRVLSLMEGTPGAWDAVNALTREQFGPKYDPMPPIPADQSKDAQS